MNIKKHGIILASSSPRRKEILQNHGMKPEIFPPNVDEDLPEYLSLEQSVMYLALKKALNVEKEYLSDKNRSLKTNIHLLQVNSIQDNQLDKKPTKANQSQKNDEAPLILAADTVVYHNSIIGKPKDKDEAFQLLKSLKNTKHLVATGVALLQPGTTERYVFSDVTEVYFNDYSDEEILEYISTDEPYDKAGGYAIQGAWGKHVHHIEGDLDNVIGLPWYKVQSLLNRLQ